MTDGSIAIDPDDMLGDARLWEQGADRLATAAQTGSEQDLPNDAFMMVGRTVALGYRDLSASLLDRLRNGASQMKTLAAVLRDTVQTFDELEHEHIRIIRELASQGSWNEGV